MQQYKILLKSKLDEFIRALSAQRAVVAPVKRGMKNYVFTAVDSAKDISLKHIPTILPPKKFFLPRQERLAEYDISQDTWNAVLEYEDVILFGVHTCDLAGIQCLNMVFADKPKDINYIARKNKIGIIGFECNDYCDEYASCAVMDNHLPNGGYDLFFTELKDSYIVHVNTLTGEEIIGEAKLFQPAGAKDKDELAAIRDRKRKIFKDEIKVKHNDLKSLFDKSLDAKVWEDLDKRCVACGNCTNVCPTCYCFDIRDEIDLDLSGGYRYRIWDSCQNEEFAKVAGNENFRPERGQRQRHRYMRKFKYPLERYSRHFCTGCGRCSRTCMAKINLKETLNQLAEQAK